MLYFYINISIFVLKLDNIFDISIEHYHLVITIEVVWMRRIQNESEMMDALKNDVLSTSKQNIKIFAGHLPLLYIDEGAGRRSVRLGIDRWGVFSTHTFELGCTLLKTAQEAGKNAQLILLVDDDDELKRDENGIRRDETKWKSPRRKFYATAELPSEYKQILAKHALDESCLVKIENSQGVVSSLISERLIKRKAEQIGIVAPNECSKAYKGILLLGSMFSKDEDYLVSFMPGQCKGNICTGVLTDIDFQLDASHAFFPHAQSMGGLSVEDGRYVQLSTPWEKELIYIRGIEYDKTQKE